MVGARPAPVAPVEAVSPAQPATPAGADREDRRDSDEQAPGPLRDRGARARGSTTCAGTGCSDGQLAELVALGVRGITSNPTIFANAISGQDTYDEQFRSLTPDHTVEEAYWVMATTDISDALDVLRPLYDESDGEDGFVSLEVSPALAHDTDGTVRDARQLHESIAQPNLFVKVPATLAGVPAIETLIGEGRSINVTLIFGLDRYDEVMEAYLRGLEALVAAGRESELSRVASVASFFVSRVDTEVDRRLEALAGGDKGDPASSPCGATPPSRRRRWPTSTSTARSRANAGSALAALGARVQRPLWASTSTKNPAYPDLLYVDTLIGPSTVNTMPERDAAGVRGPRHARTARSTPIADAAEAVLAQLGEAGVDMEDVEQTLEDEGVHAFAKSFDELLQSLTDKAATF